MDSKQPGERSLVIYDAILFSGTIAGTEILSARGDSIKAAKEALVSLPRFSDVVASLILEDDDLRYNIFFGVNIVESGVFVERKLVPSSDQVDG